MILQVETTVLNDNRWHPLLDVVVAIIGQPGSRHAFDTTQYNELFKSTWLAYATGLRATIPEFLRASARAVSREGRSEAVTIRIDDSAPFSGQSLAGEVIRIHPFGALTILLQPLHVLVEDESSDGAFILWMARILGRDVIRRAYSAGRLVFRHAGGKTQMVKSAAALSYGVWARSGQPILSMKFRAVALLDSDARFPGDQPNAQIARNIEPHLAFAHVLNGRSIENYLPQPYARRRLQKDGLGAAVDSFFKLSEAQREHFPLKRGFRDVVGQAQSHASFMADNSRHLSERGHFAAVSTADWPQYAGGFGDQFAEVYQEPEFRCSASEAGLLTNAQKQELSAFLTRVITYL